MSWSLLFIEAFIAAFALILPGMLASRAFGVPFKLSLSFGPVISVFFLVFMGIFLRFIGVAGGYFALLISLFLFAVVSGVACFLRFHKRSTFFDTDIVSLLPYLCALALSVLVTVYLFVRGIGLPDNFLQVYDNSFHLSVVQSMKHASSYSILSVGSYLEAGSEVFSPNASAGFYPAAWHIIAALVSRAFDISVMAAINLTNFVFAAFVLPLGVQSLIAALTKDDVQKGICAAVVTLAAVAFPWTLLYWGPVYPNFAAFCAIPAVASVFIWFMRGFDEHHSVCLADCSVLVAMLFGLVSLVSLQPNAVFTLGILLVPSIVACLGGLFERQLLRIQSISVKFAYYASRGIVLFAVAVIWFLMTKASFLQGVIHFNWPSFTYIFDALWRAFSFSFNESAPCILLACLVVLGSFCALGNRSYRGYFFVYLFSIMLFVVDATQEGFIRHFLTGFWYTDQYRVAAMTALFSIPLSTLGLDLILRKVQSAFSVSVEIDRSARYFPQAFCIVLIACGLFWPESVNPSINNYSPVGFTKSVFNYMYSIYDADNNLTSDELAFLGDVKQIAGDELIVNNPFDGSVYGYATNDLNLMYRKFSSFGKGETKAGKQIRHKIDRVSYDSGVASVVEQSGAKYLLVLDYDENGREGVDMPGYHKSGWVGIDSVDDSTPGFSLVLSEKDMRLYSIE